jgi:hypothetical protein
MVEKAATTSAMLRGVTRKVVVFISHSHEEAPISLVLQYWVKELLSARCEVFVSSDDNSLLPGQKWLLAVQENLQRCDLLVVVCGPDGHQRPWVNFEAGAAWIRDVPVVPLCHSGLFAKTLPLPLSLYQAIDLSDANACRRFVQRIATVAGLSRCPTADYDEMWRSIQRSMHRSRSLRPSKFRSTSSGLGPREAFSIGAGIGNLLELVPLDEGPRQRLESFLDHLVEVGFPSDGPIKNLRVLINSLRKRTAKARRLTVWERKAAIECINYFWVLADHAEMLLDLNEFRWFNLGRYLSEARNSLKYGIAGDLVSSVATLEFVVESVDISSRLRERFSEFIKMAAAKDVNGVHLADGIIKSVYLSLN